MSRQGTGRGKLLPFNLRNAYWKEAAEVFQPVRTGDNAYYHPLYIEAVKRLPYIEHWLDEFIEEGGKEEWRKFQHTPEMIT